MSGWFNQPWREPLSRFRHAVAGRDAHITSLRLIIVVLLLACAGMWYGWQNAPEHLTVYNPPDLRSGSTRKWWVVPPSTVYTFAYYIWQQINRWPSNGLIDYKKNLYQYQYYLTPDCRAYLATDFAARKNRRELENRVRGLYEIPGRGYAEESVRILNRDAWIVRLDAEINEYLHGMPVRNLYIRYFLRVIRRDVDSEKNPWGLMIDCFAKPPVEIMVPQSDAAKKAEVNNYDTRHLP